MKSNGAGNLFNVSFFLKNLVEQATGAAITIQYMDLAVRFFASRILMRTSGAIFSGV
jgi:hypothetical protein